MTEPPLDGPGVVALVGERVAASMAQHVSMNREGYLGLDASPLDHLGQAGNRERGTALAYEDKGRLGLTLQNPQRPEFIAKQWMRGGCSALGSAQMQVAGLELNIAPLKLAQLRGPQAVPEGDQDHGGIAVPMAIALSGGNQLLNLALGQMLARADIRIRPPGRHRSLNCPIFCSWRYEPKD
jgi:hypothetical protein